MGIERLPTSDARNERDPTMIGANLDRLLGHLGSPRSQTVSGLALRWADVVGEQVASHTHPVRVRSGTLIVSVDDPAWASELRWMTDEIAAKARAVLEDESILRIDVRVESRPPSSGA